MSASGGHLSVPRPASGRHRRRRRTGRGAVLATSAVAALVAGELATAVPAGAATADDFARLRMCESGGNYGTNTGNGYYGAYQFDLQTWHGLGYSGLPSNASPATQDAAARRLYAQRGWQPWPACSRRLGLVSGAASRGAARQEPSTVSGSTAYHGVALSTRLVAEKRHDVAQWQAQMRRRGWHIAVDGQFGPQSRSVAVAFQRSTGLVPDGIVGPLTWHASFAH